MKQQWDSLASPNQVFTILGLLKDFKFINKILEYESLQGNPSLLYGFQQVDEVTMIHLRSILLLIRQHYLKTNVTEWLTMVKPFLKSQQFNSLNQELSQLQEKIHEQLLSMDLDEQRQQQALNTIFKTMLSPFKVIGFAGVGLYKFLQAIGKSLQKKEDPLLQELRVEVSNALTLFIETDLMAAKNSLTATQARQTRCRSLLQQYREQIDKTRSDVDSEWNKIERNIEDDSLEVAQNDQIMSAINMEGAETEKQKVVMSYNMFKTNKWNEQIERKIILTRKHVFVVNEDTITRKLDFSELRGVSVLLKENEKWPSQQPVEQFDSEFLIHVKLRYDQPVICMQRPKLVQAIKFLYWRATGKNLPVNQI